MKIRCHKILGTRVLNFIIILGTPLWNQGPPIECARVFHADPLDTKKQIAAIHSPEEEIKLEYANVQVSNIYVN